jgi:hypothetical protein
MQAQHYLGGLWGIGLRLPDATEAVIEQALSDRTIVRTWPMRGTLHFVAAADVRWMLELLTPRIIAASADRARDLELDSAIFARCEKLITGALEGGRQLAREAMLNMLERNGICTAEQRGNHILRRLAQEGCIIFAARSGKSQTFALLEEWVPPAKKLGREAALAELARRYFTGHGPATLLDYVWWSGLKVSEAREGLLAAIPQLREEKVGEAVYWMAKDVRTPPEEAARAFLLPPFDEYLLGYRDRRAVLEARHAERIVPGGNGMFLPTMVVDGQVVGTWKRAVRKESVRITLEAFGRLRKGERDLIAAPTNRYSQFLGLAVDGCVLLRNGSS